MSSYFIPNGSYKETSRNIQCHVYSQSKKRDQALISAGYNLTDADKMLNLENLDGFLVAEKGSEEPKGYVPGGSYARTSEGIQVVLSSECRTISGTWIYSTMDITHLTNGKTISNINGNLTID